MTEEILTQARLKELLAYDPETGIFRWRKTITGWIKEGRALKPMEGGYLAVKIDGRRYQGHRLVWLYLHGRWPEFEIDHVNTLKGANAKGNLRDVPHSENAQNVRVPRSHSKLGVLGVVRKGAKFGAQITINGRTRSLGTHQTIEAAHAAYLSAKRQFHPGNTL